MGTATATVGTNPTPVTEEFVFRHVAAHVAAADYFPNAFAGINRTTGLFAKFTGADPDILFDGVIGNDFKQTVASGTAAKGAVIRVRQPKLIRVKTSTGIVDADLGRPVYGDGTSDDGTVSLTPFAGGNLDPIGFIHRVESATEATIRVNLHTAPNAPTPIVRIPIYTTLASIADGDVVTNLVPGFDGAIVGLEFICTTKVTTASKTTKLNVEIESTNVTGGVLELTSAGLGTAGVVISSSAVTGANLFTSESKISLEAASTTAFSEGAGTINILCRPAVPGATA